MTRVRVGEVEVRIDADLKPRELRRLLHDVASIAVALAAQAEPEPGPPIGFAAPVLERLPDDLPPDPTE